MTGTAILTVAKPGSFDPKSLVLRLYQPTNSSQVVQVALGAGRPANAPVAATAAEGAWNGPAVPIQVTSSGFQITMNNAVATVQIPG